VYIYLFTMRSLTYAQRAKRVLQNNGISSYLIKTPTELSSRGCGYGIRIKGESFYSAYDALKYTDLKPVNVFKETEAGYERVTL